MIPLLEFMQRFQQPQSMVRACDNEIELNKCKRLEEQIQSEILTKKSLEPTYWQLLQGLSGSKAWQLLTSTLTRRSSSWDH